MMQHVQICYLQIIKRIVIMLDFTYGIKTTCRIFQQLQYFKQNVIQSNYHIK